jgi:hypothetical protein
MVRSFAMGLLAAVVAGCGSGGGGGDAVGTAAPRQTGKPATASSAATQATAAIDASSAIRSGDPAAITAFLARATAEIAKDARFSEPEAIIWVNELTALRSVYLKLNPEGKAGAAHAVRGVMARFALEGTPAGWTKVLPPSYDVLSAGLADPRAEVRAASLEALGGLWMWSPGCSITRAEEHDLATWKEELYPAVVRRLADPETGVKQRAISCLGALPIDAKAAPAIAGLSDPNFAVRLSVLNAFAMRPTLLTEEAILPLLHDPVAELAGLAEKVLRARGLSPDLIGLGRMVTHAKPNLRASVIPMLMSRTDLDPTVWLLRLTEDPDETVRLRAVEACAGRLTPELVQRLKELRAADDSAAIRAAAAKALPEEKTAALPPLPGSPRLTPRAN